MGKCWLVHSSRTDLLSNSQTDKPGRYREESASRWHERPPRDSSGTLELPSKRAYPPVRQPAFFPGTTQSNASGAGEAQDHQGDPRAGRADQGRTNRRQRRHRGRFGCRGRGQSRNDGVIAGADSVWAGKTGVEASIQRTRRQSGPVAGGSDHRPTSASGGSPVGKTAIGGKKPCSSATYAATAWPIECRFARHAFVRADSRAR